MWCPVHRIGTYPLSWSRPACCQRLRAGCRHFCERLHRTCGFRRWAMCLTLVSMQCSNAGNYDIARILLLAAISLLQAAASPRRSWASCVSRVANWSFDNSYSETACWERMRFNKHHFPTLLVELELSNPGTLDGCWRVPDIDGNFHSLFQPMEILVVFLARLASRNTWSSLLLFLVGRSPTAHKYAFAFVLDHVYTRFVSKINDITRWSTHAQLFAQAIRDAGSHLRSLLLVRVLLT